MSAAEGVVHGSDPHIEATPSVGLIDSPVEIRLHGFAPSALVTVRALVEVPGRQSWRSHAVVLADAHGEVDLATQAPLFGDYLVPDGEGLVWSLRADEDSPVRASNTRFIDSGLADYEILLSAEVDGEVRARATLRRQPVGPSVRRTEIRDDGLTATLFLPAAAGPHGVVVVVPGSDGGIPEHLAALYASHGWAALALGYFNAEGLPPTLTEIPLEYFETALGWIEAHPELDEGRILLNGTSRGGELALLLASRYPRFGSVIAWVPSLYVNGGMGPRDVELGRASWTKDGVPVPFLTRPGPQEEQPGPELRDGVVVFALRSLRRLQDRAAHREFEIPVERIAGPILFISGRDDLLWPSDVYSRWAVDRLREHGFAHEVRHLSYPNAGHSVGPRANPATVLTTSPLPGNDPATQVPIHIGGTPQGIAAARQDLWPKVLAFITAQLGAPASQRIEKVQSTVPETVGVGA